MLCDVMLCLLIILITLDFRLISTVEWKLCRHILIDSFDPLKINTIHSIHLYTSFTLYARTFDSIATNKPSAIRLKRME